MQTFSQPRVLSCQPQKKHVTVGKRYVGLANYSRKIQKKLFWMMINPVFLFEKKEFKSLSPVSYSYTTGREILCNTEK